MDRTIKMLIFIFLLIAGCEKDNDTISIGSTEPAFVIDTIKVSAIVKTDASTDSSRTYISFRLACHFIGKPGSLDGISLSVGNSGYSVIFEPYGPTPIGSKLTYNDNYKDLSTFQGQDSLFVRIEFGGRFWEIRDSTIKNYGLFSIRDSLWIQLQR